MFVRYAETKDSIFSISRFSLNGLLKTATTPIADAVSK